MININTIINKLIVFQFFGVAFLELIYSYFPNFSFLLFFPEVINIFLLLMVLSLLVRRGKITRRRLTLASFFIVLFLFYSIVSFFWSDVNIYGVATRLRSISGGIFFYLVCNKFLDNQTFSKMTSMFFVVQSINLLLTIYQNQVLNLHSDFANGIFGFTGYNNGIQGTFCLALSLLALIYYLTGKWRFLKSFIMITLSSTICAIAEIKLYYVILLICSLIIVLVQKRNFKEQIKLIGIGLAIVFILFLSYKIIEQILPDNLYTFFSLEKGMQYENRTTYAGRINTIPFIYENVFHNSFGFSLIGTGIGSISEYFIYELGKTFSELGFIGTGLLYLFLSMNFFKSLVNRKQLSSEQLFVAVFSLAMMISIVVWNSFFTRTTYIVFYFLGIGFTRYISERKQVSK